MRHPILKSGLILAALTLAACGDKNGDAAVQRAFQDVNVVEESNLSDIMLTAADPNEAVSFFQRTLGEKPDSIKHMRGLGQSLVRAKRYDEAVGIWQKAVDHPEHTHEDKVLFADSLIRSGNWKRAEKVLDTVPPTHETFARYRLEAMIADSKREWKKADSFYEIAVGLTARPAPVMNNWGYSKLSRGAYKDAERMFTQAITQDNKLFTAKNNLVLARGAQGKYSLPVVPMDQTERALLLHTLGLSAIKRGDVKTGKALLREAVETHPQHFEEAARALRALEA